MSQIMKDDEINTYKIDVFDTQKFQDTFVKWFSQFKENVIDKEFENGSKGDVIRVVNQSSNKTIQVEVVAENEVRALPAMSQ